MTTFLVQPGAAIAWAAAGGDAVLTLTSLANNAARQGAKVDLGASFAERYGYRFTSKFASAPTADTLLRLFLAFSEDNTTFAGGATGSDAAYSDTDDLANTYELRPIVCDADTDAQTVVGWFEPLGRYVAPIVWNDATGQALSATAGDHALVIWPMQGVVT